MSIFRRWANVMGSKFRQQRLDISPRMNTDHLFAPNVNMLPCGALVASSLLALMGLESVGGIPYALDPPIPPPHWMLLAPIAPSPPKPASSPRPPARLSFFLDFVGATVAVCPAGVFNFFSS